MPIVPLRDVGKLGVITDIDPYDLPVSAYSFAKNIRFEDNKISRGSVFRSVGDLVNDPKHLIGFVTQNGTPQAFYVTAGGSLFEYSTSGETNRSATGYTPNVSTSPVTSCVNNNVVYVNRADRLPWYRPKDTTGTSFSSIPTNDTGSLQWHSDWRCRVLRSLYGVLIAANVTKGSSQYPNMVKWSNFSVEPNQVPPDWDYASTTSNAGENTLAEMKGQILDAYPLRNRMYLYGDVDTWMMEFTGGAEMFRFDRQFDKGVIGTNCVVEANGIHYVFGDNDIWMHDGTSDKSLASQSVRKFIYRSLRRDQAHQFFVTFNRRTNEVIFCFVSDDGYTSKFPAVTTGGCNRAAIYNVASGAWYFHDMPYVSAASMFPLLTGGGTTYATMAAVNYLNIGGSFSQSDLSLSTNLVFASYASGSITRSLRTFEDYREAGSTFTLDANANSGAYLERLGIDMDEVGAELRGYKLLSSIYPQGRLDPDAAALTFTIGSSDHPNDTTNWGDSQTYDRTYYKLDYNMAGRFLALKMEQSDFLPFTLNGYDFDITILGRF